MPHAHRRRVRPSATGLLVFALACLLATAAWAAPDTPEAADGPLDLDDVIRLLEAGVGEELLETLVREVGFEDKLTVDEIIALKEVGLSDDLVALLRRQPTGGSSVEGVTYEERDGVLVVRGHGGDSAATADPVVASPSPDAPPPVIVPPVVIQPTVLPPVTWQDDSRAPAIQRDPNAYPSGAVFGPSGSAVFVPARHGNPPSAFGRTVITHDPYAWRGHHYPHHGVHVGVPFRGHGHVTGTHHVPAAPSYGTTTIRTSRGAVSVPN